MLILGGEFFWAVRSLGSSIVQAPKNWMKPSAQNYNHKPQESFTFLYEKKCGESAFLSVLDMHDLNVLWISCVTSNRCAKNCLMIHRSSTQWKPKASWTTLPSWPSSNSNLGFSSWCYIWICNDSGGWKRRNWDGFLKLLDQSFLLFLRCRVFHHVCFECIYVHQHVSFCLKGRNMQKNR